MEFIEVWNMAYDLLIDEGYTVARDFAREHLPRPDADMLMEDIVETMEL